MVEDFERGISAEEIKTENKYGVFTHTITVRNSGQEVAPPPNKHCKLRSEWDHG